MNRGTVAIGVGVTGLLILGGFVWRQMSQGNSVEEPVKEPEVIPSDIKKDDTKRPVATPIQRPNYSQMPMAMEIRGTGRVVMDGNSVAVETSGSTIVRGMVKSSEKNQWLGFELQGDTIFIFNIATNQRIAEVLSSESSVRFAIDTEQRLSNYMSISALQASSSSSSIAAIEDKTDTKANYVRPHLIEYRELCCPLFISQATGIGALIFKKDLVREGEFYYVAAHVKTLAEQYEGNGLRFKKYTPFTNQKCLAQGTAFLGTAKRIITAGHCVEPEGQYYFGNIYFVFGFVMKAVDKAIECFPAENVYELKSIIARECTQKEDWAVIELNRAVDNKKHSISNRSEVTTKRQTPLYVMGHPLGLPMKIDLAARVKQEAISSNPHQFFTNLNTFGGNSGSPVFNMETQEVEGILVRGKDDFHYSKDGEISFAVHDVRRNGAGEYEYNDTSGGEVCTPIQCVERALRK